MIKNCIIVLAALLMTSGLLAQQKENFPYKFTTVKDIPASSVKNQFRSGTCWSFSGISFLESELLRTKKKNYDLSEMFVVYKNYLGKADRFARLHGSCHFAAGGATADVLWTFDNFGLMPEEAYAGLEYGSPKHDHAELDKVMSSFMKSIVNPDTKTLSNTWRKAFTALLEAYLGKPRDTFQFEGKSYTPRSFADGLGLKTSDFIRITSFNHSPLYSCNPIEVPDNWTNSTAYNVSLDEFTAIVTTALDNGFTCAWGGDVSEKGFSWKNGVAIVAEDDAAKLSLEGTDRDRFEKLKEKEKEDQIYKFEKIVPEKTITPLMRQTAYDTYATSDDHGMHIVGYAKDQNGTLYFKVKNSWDIDNPYQGYLYMSKAFFQYKTLDIMVHKDALTKEIKTKLGLK